MALLRSGGRVTAVLVAGVLSLAGGSATAAPSSVRPLPAPPRELVEANNLFDRLDRIPNLTPEEVAAHQGTVDGLATDLDDSSCSRMGVVASSTGVGADRTLVLRTSPVSFSIGRVPSTWWKSPPVPTAVWRLYFRGLMWVSDVALPAAAANDTAALDALITTAAQSVQANPDPGTSANGWDEGTNLRRQQALNCLYRLSGGDARLVPAIEATARANMDVNRYYGLPKNPPHNHGVMANLALLDAGDLLGRKLWRDTAAARLVRDSGGAFTASGLSIEQTAAYTRFNRDAWNQVADALATYPDPAISSQVATIRATTARATRALAYITAPDGNLVPYGDGDAGKAPITPQASGVLRDDAAGVLAGRWSWRDPATSFYLLRYGPRRWAHGHQDRTSLVWSTAGVPVLIDPATYSYDPSPYEAFSRAPLGHNVQIPRSRSLSLSAGVALKATSLSGSVHGFTTTDALYGVLHTRNWAVDSARRRVTLTDTLGSVSTTTLHLSPVWRLARTSLDKRALTFRNGTGKQLVVTGTSPLSVYTGSTRPVLGWVFPSYEKRSQAPQVLMYPPAGTSRMTLQVSDEVFTPTPR